MKLELRLERFPYKSLKTEVALTLKLLLPRLSNCKKLLTLGCSFTWCKVFILFVFVYKKNKDTFMNRVYSAFINEQVSLSRTFLFRFFKCHEVVFISVAFIIFHFVQMSECSVSSKRKKIKYIKKSEELEVSSARDLDIISLNQS